MQFFMLSPNIMLILPENEVNKASLCRLIDIVSLAQRDRSDEIFLNLHSYTQILTLNPNKLV